MNKPRKRDVFDKKLKTLKKGIIPSENIHGVDSGFFVTQDLERIYSTVQALEKIKFDSQHYKALGIPEAHVLSTKNQFETEFKFSVDEEAQIVVEKLITESIRSADAVIEAFGDQAMVVAAAELEPLRRIMIYYPLYVLTNSNYWLIRHGSKLQQEVEKQTQKQFEGYVEGRFIFNLGNGKKKGRITSLETTIEPSAPAPTPVGSQGAGDVKPDGAQEKESNIQEIAKSVTVRVVAKQQEENEVLAAAGTVQEARIIGDDFFN